MSLLLDRKRIRDGLRLSVLSVEDAIAESVVQLAIPRPPQSLPHHQKHHGGTAATAMGSGQRRIINNVPSGALSPTSASLDDLAADDWYLMRHDHSPPPALLAAIPHHFAALAHIDAVGFGSASPLVVMGSGGVTSSSGQLVFSSSPSVAVSAAAPSVGGAGTLNGPGAPIVGTEAPELTLPAVSRGASPIEPANGAEPPLQLPLPPPARRTSLPNASIIGSSPGIPVPVLPPAPPTSRRRSSLDDSAFDPPSHHSNPNVSGAERGGSSTLAPVPESSAGTPASAAAQLGDGEPLSLPQSETSAGSAAAGGAAEAFPQLPTASGHHQYRAQIIDLPMVIGSRNGSADDVASAAATAQTARSMVASTSFGEELVDYEAELAFAEDEAEDAAAAAEVSGAAAAAAARQLQQQRISRARDSTAVRRLSAGEMGKELGVIVTEPMRQGFAPPPRRPSLPFLAPILLPAISAGITTDDDYTGGGRRGLVLPPPPPVPPPVPPMTAPPTPVTPDHSTRPSSIPASLPPPTPQSEKSEAAPSLFAKRPVVALVPGKKAMPSQLAMLLGVTGTAGQNPLALNYSRYAGKHAHHSVPLKLFLPFTGEPPASISLAVARGTTVEQAIGYALFEYVERGMQPSLDAARLEPTRWAMRIAEDDGEVDDDFPALDRTRPVDRFAFDAFALCEIGGGDGNGPPIVTPSTAHSGMTFTNGTSKRANPSNGTGTRPGSAAARMDGSTTSTAAAVVGGATAGGGALASTAPAALTGQSTQFPPTVPGVGALGPAAAAAGAAASTLAAVNLPPMPIAGVPEKLFLRVHLYATVEVRHTTTLNVTSATPLAEIFNAVCRKRGVNPRDYVLRVAADGQALDLARPFGALGTGIGELFLMKLKLGVSAGDMWLRPPGEEGDGVGTGVGAWGGRGGLAAVSAYKKYAVMRKMLMGRQERVLAIDGEYLHVLPSESRASMFDSVKTSSYHVSAVLACKQNKKLPAHFRLEVLRNPSSASGGPSPGGTGAGAATATTNSGGGALLSSDVPGSLAFGVAGPGGTGGGGGPGSGNAIGPTPRRSMGSTGAGNGASGSGGGSGAAGITKDSGSGLTGIAGIAGEVTRSHVVAPAMSYNAREGKTFDFEARSADEAREICAAIATLVSAVRRRASGSGGG